MNFSEATKGTVGIGKAAAAAVAAEDDVDDVSSISARSFLVAVCAPSSGVLSDDGSRGRLLRSFDVSSLLGESESEESEEESEEEESEESEESESESEDEEPEEAPFFFFLFFFDLESFFFFISFFERFLGFFDFFFLLFFLLGFFFLDDFDLLDLPGAVVVSSSLSDSCQMEGIAAAARISYRCCSNAEMAEVEDLDMLFVLAVENNGRGRRVREVGGRPREFGERCFFFEGL